MQVDGSQTRDTEYLFADDVRSVENRQVWFEFSYESDRRFGMKILDLVKRKALLPSKSRKIALLVHDRIERALAIRPARGRGSKLSQRRINPLVL